MSDNLDRAKKLFSTGDRPSLIYAAIELRMAIERLVAEKINIYVKKYGAKLLRAYWQPNKALKVLTQLEPLSDKSYTIKIGKEDANGTVPGNMNLLGKHEALSAKWVTKHYNKLGSFVHLQGKDTNISDLKSGIEQIILEVQRAESSTIITNFGETVSFSCMVCEEKVVTCAEALPQISEIHCLNVKCNTTFEAFNDSEGNWQFKARLAEFTCPNCEVKTPVLENELKVGVRLNCDECGERFKITHNNWMVERIE
jgi:transcription elongation factor Elf1